MPLPDNFQRWTAARKDMLVKAIESGEITIEAACDRYDLSLEEVMTWQRRASSFGRKGLHVQKLQKYRLSEVTP